MKTLQVATPGRRVTRRNSQLIEESTQKNTPITTTPRRTTRRSASIQSEDDVPIGRSVKEPTQPTIQEVDELPVARRTRRLASVTSEDDTTSSIPTIKVATAKKPTIESVKEEIEDEEYPSRPKTRSMSSSPANVSSPKKSPHISVSPLVVNKQDKSPRRPLLEKSPVLVEQNKITDGDSKKSPAKSSPTQPNVTTAKSFTSNKAPNSTSKLDTNNKLDAKAISLSRSWCHSVRGTAKGGKIDEFNVKKPLQGISTVETKTYSSGNKYKQKIDEIQFYDSDLDNDENDLVDDEAEEAEGYQTDDSKNTEEREAYHKERMDVEAKGVELGSSETESDMSSGEEDINSFIVSEEEQELLSYSDDDEHLEDTPALLVRRRRIVKIDDSSASEDEQPSTQIQLETEKLSLEKKLPLRQQLTLSDPEISLNKEVVIFDKTLSALTRESLLLHNKICNEVEPMDVDVTIDETKQPVGLSSNTLLNLAETGSNDEDNNELSNSQVPKIVEGKFNNFVFV